MVPQQNSEQQWFECSACGAAMDGDEIEAANSVPLPRCQPGTAQRWRWSFPLEVVDFLKRQNGAMLFSGSLNLYGVVEPSRLLNREDRFSLPPFNIERENQSWTVDPERLLVAGGYRFDGSRACVDRTEGQVHIFQKGQCIPSVSWLGYDAWLTSEIGRLSTLFDEEGKMIGPEAETSPGAVEVDPVVWTEFGVVLSSTSGLNPTTG